MTMIDIKADAELLNLLEASRHHIMTSEEKAAQRESWVRGEMGMGSDADEAEYVRKIRKDK